MEIQKKSERIPNNSKTNVNVQIKTIQVVAVWCAEARRSSSMRLPGPATSWARISACSKARHAVRCATNVMPIVRFATSKTAYFIMIVVELRNWTDLIASMCYCFEIGRVSHLNVLFDGNLLL